MSRRSTRQVVSNNSNINGHEKLVLTKELRGLLSGLANGVGARSSKGEWWKGEGLNWWEMPPDIKPVKRKVASLEG